MKKLIKLFYSQFYITCSLFGVCVIFSIIMGIINFERMVIYTQVGIVFTYFVSQYLASRISAVGRKVSQRPGILRYLNEISKDVKFNRAIFYKTRKKLVVTGKIFHYLLLIFSIFTICNALLIVYIYEDAYALIIVVLVIATIGCLFSVRSFFVNLKQDEFGARLEKTENSRIYRLMDNICDEIGIGHIELIYVVNLPNVLIAYDLGHKQHILRIGVHYLTNLSDEELRVILKHEAMHIKNHDTRNSAKSYREMERWRKMLTKGGPIFNSFGNVYIILVTIYNDILARFDEVEADKNIILNDDECNKMTSALVKTFFISEFYERLYYELRLFDYDKPIPDMIEKSVSNFNDFTIKHEARLLSKVKKIRSITYDTHLSILERLEILGVKQEDIGFERHFNQANYDEIKAIFPYINKEWEASVVDEWHKLSSSIKEGRNVIENFKDTGRVDDLINLGLEYERVFEFERALEVYERAIQIDKNNIFANLRKGYLLLFNDNDAGIELVRNAIDSKSEIANDAIDVLLEYCYKNGMNELVEELLVWSTDKLEQGNKKLETMSRINFNTKLVPHILNEKDQQALDEVTRDFIGINQTYVVKKINDDQTERVVILLECKKDLPISERVVYQQKIVNVFIDSVVFIEHKRFSPFVKRVIRVANQENTQLK